MRQLFHIPSAARADYLFEEAGLLRQCPTPSRLDAARRVEQRGVVIRARLALERAHRLLASERAAYQAGEADRAEYATRLYAAGMAEDAAYDAARAAGASHMAAEEAATRAFRETFARHPAG